MTAGKGIVHGEMFPLLHPDKPNTLHLFQIWLNLPARNKMSDPHFIMHWGEDIPHIHSSDGLTEVTVWAGELHGSQPLKGPPKSYANVDDSQVAVWFLRMKPGGTYTLPPAAGGTDINRTIYWFHGTSASVGGQVLDSHKRVDVDASQDVTVCHPTTSASKEEDETYFLVLQGRPIGEPVVQHGPFVMNSQKEIMQAFQDYQKTQFGGWPWPTDSVTHPRDKGRFALCNGIETFPPSSGESKSEQNESGTRVVLEGLSSALMNGKTGTKGKFDEAKGRFEVTLDSDGKTVLVKPENIREVEL